MTEILDTLIAYEMTFIAKGARKERTALVSEVVPVPIGTLSEPRTAGSLGDTLWIAEEDRLYFDWSSANPGVTFEAAAVNTDNAVNPFKPFGVAGSLKTIPAATAPEQLRMRDIVSTTRAAALARAQDIGRHIGRHSGRTYIESDGPIICMSAPPEKQGTKHRVITVANAAKGLPNSATKATISVHDLDALSTILLAHGLKQVAPFTCDLADPDMFPQTAAHMGVLGAGAQFVGLEDMPNRNIYNVTQAHLDAYLRYTEPEFDRSDVDAVAAMIDLALTGEDELNYQTARGREIRELVLQCRLSMTTLEYERRRLDRVAAPTP